MKKKSKLQIFLKNLGKLIDKKVITPLTKLIVNFSKITNTISDKLENSLSATNTMLFVSLFISLVIFFMIDQKMLVLTENSAEVLKSQEVTAIYNEESYVIEGLPETVDVTLIGSKADLYFAKQSPSNGITVDLSSYTAGTHEVALKYNQVLSSVEYQLNPSTCTINIYPKVSTSKTLSVDILNKDKLGNKYVISDIKLKSDEVVIKGAEHQISKVSEVKALVDVENLTNIEVGTQTLENVLLKAYDKNGNPIDIEIVPDKITVDVIIKSPSKEVPIKVITKGEPALGSGISTISSSETKVTVYGDENVLEKLTYIPIEIDVDGLDNDKSYKIELSKPVGITSMSVSNLTVDISVSNSTTRTLKDIAIEYRNLDEKYTVQGMSKDDIAVDVIVTGTKSVVENIEEEDIKVYLDLSDNKYVPGTYEVEVEAEGKDVRATYKSKTIKVKIKIS